MEKKHIILNYCLGILLAFFSVLPAQAQTRTVKGTVIDELGEPVIGASVLVEKTTVGTITDLDGHFAISVPDKGKLVISFIGYVTRTISDFKETRIVLKEDMMKLDEVVVVGYGTQRMKNVTGAISTVTPQEISDLSVGSLSTALSGLVNGLSVSGGDSRPGESARLTIRQADVASSFSSVPGYVPETGPLYVIDDYIATESAFNNLDPNVIENIAVLKDAAAAVYGARSAQGVILVKTKRGHVGAPKISYSGQFGYVDEVSRPKMLNSYDYGVLWNGMISAGTTEMDVVSRSKDLFQASELEAMKSLNYDLLEKEWSAALTQKHSINVSGGSDRATYFANVSYFTQDGNLGKIDYNRWSYRAGVDAKISKWLKASLQVSGDYGEKNTALNKVGGTSGETDYNSLLSHPRYIPDYVNGKPIASYGVGNVRRDEIQHYHFDALQNSGDYSQNMPQAMTINTSLEYDFGWNKILKGLKFKVSYSKSVSTSKTNQLGTDYVVYQLIERGTGGNGSSTNGHLYTGSDVDLSVNNFKSIHVANGGNGSFLSRSMSRADSYQLNFIATYARKIGLHDISGLFTIEKSEAEAEDLEGMVMNPLSFTDGQSTSANGTQSTKFNRTESGMLSYAGRINYSYADRYLLEFLVRTDASTKFAPENYWGVFPSISAGWVISEESWFKNKVKGIDYLKIRGSFGLLGKDNIKPWGWVQLYGIGNNKGAIFGTSTSNPLGSAIQSSDAPNRDAHWDKSYKTNFGIDLRTMNDRLSANIDGYYEMNRDVFMTREGASNFPATVGTKPTAENYGSIDTYGLELSLGWRDVIGKNFKYFVKINTGYSDNKVKEKPWKALIPLDQVHPNQRSYTGEWGLECLGMFRSYQEIEEYFTKYEITNYLGLTKENVHPGMLIYRDIRGKQNADGTYQERDGVVSREEDLVKISSRGNIYGFTTNFGGEWKGFSFSAQIGANWGGYSVLPKTARGIQNLISSSGNHLDMEYTNLPSFWANNMFVYKDVVDASGNVVAVQNLNAIYPNLRYSINQETSTFWKVSGTRVSLKTITLAYSLPKSLLNKVGVEGCRFNVTGQNMLSFYNPYPDNFMDPMMGTYGNYPTLRKITLGVNVSF